MVFSHDEKSIRTVFSPEQLAFTHAAQKILDGGQYPLLTPSFEFVGDQFRVVIKVPPRPDADYIVKQNSIARLGKPVDRRQFLGNRVVVMVSVDKIEIKTLELWQFKVFQAACF